MDKAWNCATWIKQGAATFNTSSQHSLSFGFTRFSFKRILLFTLAGNELSQNFTALSFSTMYLNSENPTQVKIYHFKMPPLGLPWWSSGKESAYQCRGHGFDPWLGN